MEEEDDYLPKEMLDGLGVTLKDFPFGLREPEDPTDGVDWINAQGRIGDLDWMDDQMDD